MYRLAINGYGRIGRGVLRALRESRHTRPLQIVAINEPADIGTIVHLTRYDSTHGRFPAEVEGGDEQLLVAGEPIAVSHVEDLRQLPATITDVDLVLECSGRFDSSAALQPLLDAGAPRVLLSQPGTAEIPAIVYGLNEAALPADARLISAASCTTNCIAPVLSVIDGAFGIDSGNITTMHSVMNDQPVLDAYHHTDLRKTRAAGLSMIPVDTALASGIGRVLPGLADRLTARAVRIPTHNVSAMEVTAVVRDAVDVSSVNARLQQAAATDLRGILRFNEEPLASCDFNHDSASCIVDAEQTRVVGRTVSLWVWFDNEWGYANRMLDVAEYWLNQQS